MEKEGTLPGFPFHKQFWFTINDKRIVVALGRNAFGTLFPDQKKAVAKAASAIADLVEEKYQIAITFSNGPQVGMIHTAMTEFSRLSPEYTVAPMSICGALSQPKCVTAP